MIDNMEYEDFPPKNLAQKKAKKPPVKATYTVNKKQPISKGTKKVNTMTKEQLKKTRTAHKTEIIKIKTQRAKLKADIKKHKLLMKQAKLVYKMAKTVGGK